MYYFELIFFEFEKRDRDRDRETPETAGTRDGRSGAAMGAATALRLPL